ncbi:hypothetical protein niasHT_033062 [Heterodera trifolii]|uniref:Uncharacterized protein n=1 Tax=Heterodera trifolii TaxID=157864 RepID=A0ABD2IQS2_9BILA
MRVREQQQSTRRKAETANDALGQRKKNAKERGWGTAGPTGTLFGLLDLGGNFGQVGKMGSAAPVPNMRTSCAGDAGAPGGVSQSVAGVSPISASIGVPPGVSLPFSGHFRHFWLTSNGLQLSELESVLASALCQA